MKRQERVKFTVTGTDESGELRELLKAAAVEKLLAMEEDGP